MLEAKGRVVLKTDCASWLEQAVAGTRVAIAPLTAAIAADSTHLPGDFHGHPADRLIVATVRSLNATLLTRDRAILEYAKGRYVDVLEV